MTPELHDQLHAEIRRDPDRALACIMKGGGRMKRVWKPISLNQIVRVKPTEAGLRKLEARRNELRRWTSDEIDWNRWNAVDAEGYLKVSLHEAFALFGGRGTGMGCSVLIETFIWLEDEEE